MNLTIFSLEARKKVNNREEIVSTVHRSMNCVYITTDNFTKWRIIETINNTNKNVGRFYTIPYHTIL